MIFKNKKADSSIALLVLLTLALCVSALFYFYISEKNRETEIVSFGILNDFYVQADATDYFIKNLAKEIITSNPSMDKETFLKEFRENFAIYSWNLKSDAVGSMRFASYDVQIKDNVLYLTISNFTSGESYGRKNGGIYNITYNRDMHFEIPFKQ